MIIKKVRRLKTCEARHCSGDTASILTFSYAQQKKTFMHTMICAFFKKFMSCLNFFLSPLYKEILTKICLRVDYMGRTSL
jgi:hypothetical protein